MQDNNSVTFICYTFKSQGVIMTIYQVTYYNNYGERVADFGFYEDKLDAEKRAFEVRI